MYPSAQPKAMVPMSTRSPKEGAAVSSHSRPVRTFDNWPSVQSAQRKASGRSTFS